jgi:hypothetical protein
MLMVTNTNIYIQSKFCIIFKNTYGWFVVRPKSTGLDPVWYKDVEQVREYECNGIHYGYEIRGLYNGL